MADEPTPEEQAAKDLAALSPEERAAAEAQAEPAPPAPDGSEPQVMVKLAWPTDKLITDIEGVGTVTRTPQQIPQAKLAELLEAARQTNTTVIEIGD